jgi:hypothetical protein
MLRWRLLQRGLLAGRSLEISCHRLALVDWPRRMTGRGFSKSPHSHRVKRPERTSGGAAQRETERRCQCL